MSPVRPIERVVARGGRRPRGLVFDGVAEPYAAGALAHELEEPREQGEQLTGVQHIPDDDAFDGTVVEADHDVAHV